MRQHLLASGLVAALLVGGTLPALANGGKAKGLHLVASVEGIAFTADIDPYLFELTSAGGKYRVIRIKLINRGSKPVALSSTDDTIRVEIDDQAVAGIIDLPRLDAPFWDGLSSSLRRDLVYPRTVDANEEESVFVYVPIAEVKAAPKQVQIQFSIKTLASPAVLRSPVAAAKS